MKAQKPTRVITNSCFVVLLLSAVLFTISLFASISIPYVVVAVITGLIIGASAPFLHHRVSTSPPTIWRSLLIASPSLFVVFIQLFSKQIFFSKAASMNLQIWLEAQYLANFCIGLCIGVALAIIANQIIMALLKSEKAV